MRGTMLWRILAGLCCAVMPAGASAAPAVAEPGVTLPDTAQWTMQTAAGRRYQIYAAWPADPAPAAGFPIVYVLDGNGRFATMVEAIRTHGRVDRRQQAIVIGIGYPADLDPQRERVRDLTFAPAPGQKAPPGAGGADMFLDFIAHQLKPEVARRYRVDAGREMLFGHSFGGLLASYALVTRPGLFDLWSSASPSIWYADRWLLSDAAQKPFAAHVARMAAKPRLLVTVGSYEQAPDPDFPDPRAAELLTLRQVDGARDFAAAVGKAPGTVARFALIERENHGSVVPAAIAHTVRFLFAADRIATP